VDNEKKIATIVIDAIPILNTLSGIENLTEESEIVNGHLHGIYSICGTYVLDEACSIACNSIPNTDWFVNNCYDLLWSDITDLYTEYYGDYGNYNAEIDNLISDLFKIMIPAVNTLVPYIINVIRINVPTLKHPFVSSGHIPYVTATNIPYGYIDIYK